MTQFKGLRQIEPYTAGSQPQEKNIIKLNTNENAYDPSPEVTKALRNFDSRSLRKYSSLDQPELRQVLAKQLGVQPEQLIVGNGSDDILSLAFLAFFNSQDPVLFPDLTYGFYKVWAELYRVPYREIPLTKAFEIDFADYQGDLGGVIIANPNAPTGLAKPLSEIEQLLEANPDSVVIVDEAYISFGGQTVLPLLDQYDNLFITRTFSKDAALAGLRVGYGIGSPDLIKVMKAVKNSVNPYSVDNLAESLAVAAANDWTYYEQCSQKVKSSRDWFAEELRALGFEVLPSSANFVLTRPRGISASKLFRYLEDRKIYVRYFSKIKRLKDYLRISIGTQEEMEKVIMTIQELN